jgi:hypothetical protein
MGGIVAAHAIDPPNGIRIATLDGDARLWGRGYGKSHFGLLFIIL